MKKILYIVFLAAFMFAGCKKFLEHAPDDRTQIDNPDKVAELLVSAYPHANYITFCEAMSDNAQDKGTSGRDDENALPWQYKDQNRTDYDTPTMYWAGCYKAIAAANEALAVIEKMDNASAYSASKGEALLARAYAHFMLVTFFAKAYDPATAASDPGIPYVTKPEDVLEGEYSRGTVAEVYNMIEQDIKAGIPLIKNESYRIPKYHFTTAAAYAFATRFYLFKKDYESVVMYANKAFPTSNIANSLRAWNTPLYMNAGYYELQALYTNSTQNANLLLAEANSIWGRNLAFYNYAFESVLLREIFAAPNNPARITLAMTRKIFGAQPQYYNIPKFGENFVRETISANFGEPYNVIPLFTVEEVLFNRAEALANLGKNEEAVADIDAYLSKRILLYSPSLDKFSVEKATNFYAGANAKEALIKSVLNFKRQEFLFEGMRWLDILRLKIEVKHQSVTGDINITLGPEDPRRILQLPKEAIAYGLAANPR